MGAHGAMDPLAASTRGGNTVTQTTKLIAACAAVVVLSAGAGFAGGYWASALHPGPPGKDGEQVHGCWNATLGSSTTLREFCFHDRVGP